MGKATPTFTVKYGTTAKTTDAVEGKFSLGAHSVTGTAVVPVPYEKYDLNPKLKLVATDKTFKGGMADATATLEIPGKGSLTYSAASKSVKAEVSGKTTVAEKPLALKFTHDTKGKQTSTLDSTYTVSKATKLNAKYNFNTNAVALKCTQTVDKWTVEPSYDTGSKAWSVNASTKVKGKNMKLTYASSKKATVEYSMNPYKVTLSAPTNNVKAVTLGFTAEKTY